MKDRIIRCMENNGIILPESFPEVDYNILEQTELSSIQFVSLIVALEEEFQFEFPTDLLNSNLLASTHNLIDSVIAIVQNKENC